MNQQMSSMSTKIDKLKLTVLKDTLENIKKKQERNKSYIKVDFFSAKYYNEESLSEYDLLEITDYVIECIVKAGYKVDLETNRIYWD